MRRLLGTALVLDGIAHAGIGMTAGTVGRTWFAALLLTVATLGFVAAGAGLIGVPRLDRQWLPIVAVAAAASIVLSAGYVQPLTLVLSGIDGALLIATIPWAREIVLRQLGIPLHPPRRSLFSAGSKSSLVPIARKSDERAAPALQEIHHSPTA